MLELGDGCKVSTPASSYTLSEAVMGRLYPLRSLDAIRRTPEPAVNDSLSLKNEAVV